VNTSIFFGVKIKECSSLLNNAVVPLSCPFINALDSRLDVYQQKTAAVTVRFKLHHRSDMAFQEA